MPALRGHQAPVVPPSLELIVTGSRRVTTPRRFQDAEEHDDVTGVETQGKARSRSRAAPRASAPSGNRRAPTNNPWRPRATEPQQAAPDSGHVPRSPKHKMALRPGGPCHACACTSAGAGAGPQAGPHARNFEAPESVCADPSNTDLAPRPAGRKQLENDRDASALPAVYMETIQRRADSMPLRGRP
ncbi:hypothetical protein WJX82_002988 [Trebouxia sp. C0006]